MRTIKVFFLVAILSLCCVGVRAQELSYKGTFSAIKGDKVFSVEDVVFNITLNAEQKTADFSTIGVCFGERMPRGLNMIFTGVKYTLEDDCYTFEIDQVKPTVNGEAFGKATFNNFLASADEQMIIVGFGVKETVMGQFEGTKQ